MGTNRNSPEHHNSLFTAAFSVVLLALCVGVYTGQSQAAAAVIAFVAVLAALFREDLVPLLYPFEVELQVTRKPLFEATPHEHVYHLYIINKHLFRPITGCSVLLKGIKRGDKSEEIIPVERLFRWAPAEFREREVTIWNRPTADFGRLIARRADRKIAWAREGLHQHDLNVEDANKFVDDRESRMLNARRNEEGIPDSLVDGGFFLTFYRHNDQRQGGYLHHWIKPGEIVQYRLQIRALGFKSPHDYLIRITWDGEFLEDSTVMPEHLKISAHTCEPFDHSDLDGVVVARSSTND